MPEILLLNAAVLWGRVTARKFYLLLVSQTGKLTTGLLKKQFLKAFDGNFQGDGGVRTMEKDFLYSFNKEIAMYSNIPFLKGILKYKAPAK